ncbi:MAG: hypothetical protein ABIK47_02570 [candidate division WOR-3 bacterium]
MKKVKRKPLSKTRSPKYWVWIVSGVAIVFILFLLARILSQPPRSQTDRETVELAQEDLETYTRMLGRVFIDTLTLAALPFDLKRSLSQVDTMIANRELRDAIARLTKLQPKRPRLEQAAISLYIGYSYFELGQPQNALRAFQEGITILNSSRQNLPPAEKNAFYGLLANLGFNSGYLFQFYSMPESALTYYQLSRQALDSLFEPPGELAAWLFNNLGAAAEKTADTITAREAYLAALTYIDTTTQTTMAARLRKNISRLSNKPK